MKEIKMLLRASRAGEDWATEELTRQCREDAEGVYRRIAEGLKKNPTEAKTREGADMLRTAPYPVEVIRATVYPSRTRSVAEGLSEVSITDVVGLRALSLPRKGRIAIGEIGTIDAAFLGRLLAAYAGLSLEIVGQRIRAMSGAGPVYSLFLRRRLDRSVPPAVFLSGQKQAADPEQDWLTPRYVRRDGRSSNETPRELFARCGHTLELRA